MSEETRKGISSMPPHIITFRQRESNFGLSLSKQKKEHRLFKAPIFVARRLEDEENETSSQKKENKPTYGSQQTGKVKKMEIIREDSSFENNSSDGENSSDPTTTKKNEGDQEESNQKTVNIFLQRKLFDADLIEHNLGKAEWFNKIQQANRPTKVVTVPVLRKDLSSSMMSSISGMEDSTSGDLKNFKEKIVASNNSPTTKKKSSFQKQPSSAGERRITGVNFSRLNKEDVIEEINKINERLEQNQINDSKIIQGMKFSDKIHVSKDARIFARFENIKKVWNFQANTLALKVSRPPTDSVLTHTLDGRVKKEMAQTMDLIKTDEERLGRKYWYVNLRNYSGNKKQENQEGLKDLKKYFQKSSLDFEKDGLEIIRKPHTAESHQRSKSNNWIEKNEYFKNIQNQNKKKLAIIKPTTEQDIDKLEIFGSNKLIAEADILRKEIRENMFRTFLKPKKRKIFVEDDTKEETYAEDHPKKEFMSKTSTGIFPNLSWGSLRL